jgi:hypothetical protein
MAVRDDFTAGEVLAAADLNDTFASKPPFAYGTATPSTTVDGFIWYDENSTPPAPKFWDGAAFQAIGGGKILQVVRATDATNRTTTSSTFVDVTGMSVTITPQKSTSIILVIAAFIASPERSSSNNAGMKVSVTDSSNNDLSGGQGTLYFDVGGLTALFQLTAYQTIIGHSTPATTSAITYKLRFANLGAGTARLSNETTAGQMYAIEVSA